VTKARKRRESLCSECRKPEKNQVKKKDDYDWETEGSIHTYELETAGERLRGGLRGKKKTEIALDKNNAWGKKRQKSEKT